MALGKKMAIFDWEWGRNSAPREGQKIPWHLILSSVQIYKNLRIKLRILSYPLV